MAKTTEELLEHALEQNSELTKQVGSLTDQIQALTEQVAYLTRKLYGSHSEKLVDPNQLSLLEDSSVFTDPEQTGEQSESAAPAAKMEPKKKKKKATRKETLSPDMPTVEETIPCEQPTCPEGHELTNAGKLLVREELITIPRKTYRRKVYEAVKKCEPCSIEQDRGVFFQGHDVR